MLMVVEELRRICGESTSGPNTASADFSVQRRAFTYQAGRFGLMDVPNLSVGTMRGDGELGGNELAHRRRARWDLNRANIDIKPQSDVVAHGKRPLADALADPGGDFRRVARGATDYGDEFITGRSKETIVSSKALLKPSSYRSKYFVTSASTMLCIQTSHVDDIDA